MNMHPARVGLAVGVTVTLLLAVVPRVLPDRYAATVIGGLFLGCTWFFVWRHDDATVRAHGLDLGGLIVPGAPTGELLRRGVRASLAAIVCALIVLGPFAIGYMQWYRTRAAFHFPWTPLTLARELGTQIALVAFPEEAFYRGFLQTRLALGDTRKVRLLGAEVGLSLLVTSVLFALGHLATISVPTRLAVFFPSLLFGWLRTRTGGIGAPVLLHALCNVFSETLGRGFGLY